MLPAIDPVTTSSWIALTEHFKEAQKISLSELFEKDPARPSKFSIEWDDFFVGVLKYSYFQTVGYVNFGLHSFFHTCKCFHIDVFTRYFINFPTNLK